MIASAAMMLRLSFDLEEEAAAVESAIESAINDDIRTTDIAVNPGAAVDTKTVSYTHLTLPTILLV